MLKNEKKKKKRVPHEKTNTCFKWHHFPRTITSLSLEEVGLLYIMLQIADDEKNRRYDFVDDDFTEKLLKEKEEEYAKLFEKLIRENTVFRNLFGEHRGQIKSSRNYYEELVRRIKKHNDDIDNENNEETEEETTEETTTTGTTTEKTTAEEKEKRDYSYSKDGYVILSEKAYEEIEKQKLNAEDIEDYMIANIDDFNNDYLTIEDVLAQYTGELLLS